MFDFKKLCDSVESLNSFDRAKLIAEQSVKVVAGIHALGIEACDSVMTLSAFIIGAVTSDGVLDEKEYLLIYPSLVAAFGTDVDYESIKQAVKSDREGKKLLQKYTMALMEIISSADEDLQSDIILLILMLVAIDGKISLKERRYVRKLISK